MQDAGHFGEGAATAIAIAVVEHNECFLIGRRPPGIVLADYWEFPGGKVLDGEEPRSGAARECREETGLEVEVVRLLCECDYEFDHGRLHLQFFHCRLIDAAQEPRSPFRWVKRRELAGYEFPPANEKLLRMLLHDCVQPLPTKLM
jgi:8-oxo-dGTP diphosphatase